MPFVISTRAFENFRIQSPSSDTERYVSYSKLIPAEARVYGLWLIQRLKLRVLSE